MENGAGQLMTAYRHLRGWEHALRTVVWRAAVDVTISSDGITCPPAVCTLGGMTVGALQFGEFVVMVCSEAATFKVAVA